MLANKGRQEEREKKSRGRGVSLYVIVCMSL